MGFTIEKFENLSLKLHIRGNFSCKWDREGNWTWPLQRMGVLNIRRPLKNSFYPTLLRPVNVQIEVSLWLAYFFTFLESSMSS